MELLTTAEYERLARLGGLLRDRFGAVMTILALPFAVRAIASLVSIDFSALGESAAAKEILRLFQLALLCRGTKAYKLFAVSTVTSEAEIQQVADALEAVLIEFQPTIRAALDAARMNHRV